MPRQLDMPRLSMPEYTPELEYTMDLGAESRVSTPRPDDSLALAAPSPIRTRSWRPEGVERDQQAHSTAYDSDGKLKVAARARRAAARDCGICEEVAIDPVKTQCCDALFCRQHIEEWIYAPRADGLCPSCTGPCVLPPSRPHSPSPSHHSHSSATKPSSPPTRDILTDSLRRGASSSSTTTLRPLPRPRTPPSTPSHSGSHTPVSPPSRPGTPTSSSSSAVASSTKPKPKYSRPGMDALVRLLSGLAALLLLLGALSRRGGGGGGNSVSVSVTPDSGNGRAAGAGAGAGMEDLGAAVGLGMGVEASNVVAG
ncbi:hypothetical protein R3P38DRAFT_3183987 [Favolaschia claudopus]|uniref:RING-type domain-containing protein n=1 Tax=Favolaschia claudopus TaxID=2862362 RepID=A0AAW0CBF6_9AGAR